MPPKRRSTKKMRRKKGKERAADGTFQGDENLQDPVLSHPAYTKQKEFLDLERSFLLEKKSRLKAALQSLHADEKMLREAGKDAMESREYDSMVWDMIQDTTTTRKSFGIFLFQTFPLQLTMMQIPAENEGTGALFSVESDDEMWDDDAGDDEEDPGEGFDIDEEW
ncbi:hypothetical protein BC829DRAFT_383491 [Chytridium lagenaria]|nr:hypothetical protein BC829DRAFT_383491 [Chytridium lagenaria]